MQFNAPNPGMDFDGDYDPASDLWQQANAQTWKPKCWYMSPEQMVAQDQAWLMHNMAYTAIAATKHSNPPAHTALRDF